MNLSRFAGSQRYKHCTIIHNQHNFISFHAQFRSLVKELEDKIEIKYLQHLSNKREQITYARFVFDNYTPGGNKS